MAKTRPITLKLVRGRRLPRRQEMYETMEEEEVEDADHVRDRMEPITVDSATQALEALNATDEQMDFYDSWVSYIPKPKKGQADHLLHKVFLRPDGSTFDHMVTGPTKEMLALTEKFLSECHIPKTNFDTVK